MISGINAKELSVRTLLYIQMFCRSFFYTYICIYDNM